MKEIFLKVKTITKYQFYDWVRTAQKKIQKLKLAPTDPDGKLNSMTKCTNKIVDNKWVFKWLDSGNSISL